VSAARVRRKAGFRVTESLFYGVLRAEYVQYSGCIARRILVDASRRKLLRSQWLCRPGIATLGPAARAIGKLCVAENRISTDT
jgi:hypothetical protein